MVTKKLLTEVNRLRENAEGKIYKDSDKIYLIIKRRNMGLLGNGNIKWDIDRCAFCGAIHDDHGEGSGHRTSHCHSFSFCNYDSEIFSYIFGRNSIFQNRKGQIFNSRNGYVIKDIG